MRIIGLNVRQGGARHLDRLCQEIGNHQPDVVALSEVLQPTHRSFVEKLSGLGMTHASWQEVPAAVKGVLIASRRPFELINDNAANPERWRHLWFSEAGIHVIGVHFLTQPARDCARQIAQWKWALETLAAVKGPWVIVGDMNSGLPADRPGVTWKFNAESQFHTLVNDLGCDLWRAKNPGEFQPTWLSKKRDGTFNGFRLDHAIGNSAVVDRTTTCEYLHVYRDAGLTDHSAVLVEIK